MTNRQGQIVQHYGYTAFGSERYKHNTATFDVTCRYTGQPIDDQTGLYFYQSRYYDPQLGRFTQADTIVPSADTSQALNRYAYVKNNPLKFTDPDGHGWFSDIWKKIKGFIGIIVTVALTPFVGPVFASIIGSAVGTLVNGGTWKSFAIGVGIGLAAGVIASGLGSSFGGGDFLSGAADYFSKTGGAFAQWAGEGVAQAFAAGALTGAIAGGISSAVYGTNVGRSMLEGMAGGAIGVAVGMATATVLEAGKKFIAGMNATAEATPDEVQLIADSNPNAGKGDPNCLADLNSPYSTPAESFSEWYLETPKTGLGPLLVVLGSRLKFLKDSRFLGADSGSSLASHFFRWLFKGQKMSPLNPLAKIFHTGSLGGAVGRAIPILGWVAIASDFVYYGAEPAANFIDYTDDIIQYPRPQVD